MKRNEVHGSRVYSDHSSLRNSLYHHVELLTLQHHHYSTALSSSIVDLCPSSPSFHHCPFILSSVIDAISVLLEPSSSRFIFAAFSGVVFNLWSCSSTRSLICIYVSEVGHVSRATQTTYLVEGRDERCQPHTVPAVVHGRVQAAEVPSGREVNIRLCLVRGCV